MAAKKIIELEDVQDMRDKVLALDTKWISKILPEMQKKNPAIKGAQEVYNIIHGRRKNQEDRRLFIKCALQLIRKNTKENEKIMQEVESAA